VKAGRPTTVLLSFNSGIEVRLSRVFIVSLGDVHTPAVIAAGKKPGQLLVEVPALAPGEYALKCRVFAADGHMTEEIIRFHVSE
jgi:methionine-rich copper-binding protein CopC